jgi:hypothetical protein
MAPALRSRNQGVGLRRLAWGAKLSVASEAGFDRGVIYIGLLATEEVERRQRWQTPTAVAAATGVCDGSS